jgi:hypothetical protein
MMIFLLNRIFGAFFAKYFCLEQKNNLNLCSEFKNRN